jgi:hypothetical protein
MSISPELANATMVRLTVTPPDARAIATTEHHANPAIFMIGGFNIIATKYADGHIVVELAEGSFNIGATVEFAECGAPVSYSKLVKYGNRAGNRIVRLCRNPEYKGADNTDPTQTEFKLVLGRMAAGTGTPFVRIKAVFSLNTLCVPRQVEVYQRVNNLRELRTRVANRHGPQSSKTSCDTSELLERLRAMRVAPRPRH